MLFIFFSSLPIGSITRFSEGFSLPCFTVMELFRHRIRFLCFSVWANIHPGYSANVVQSPD